MHESDQQEHVRRVESDWRSFWAQSKLRPDRSVRGKFVRRMIALTGGFSSSRYTLAEFMRHSGPLSEKRILDAGAGTGLNSLPLAQRGAEVTLLDIAPEALAIARGYFQDCGQKAQFIEGSIFKMPFADESFDIVWNTGVIEHFKPTERKQAIAEMLRVVKPTGFMITFNPSAHASVYRYAKRKAEERGTWDVGFELPIDTLTGDIDPSRYRVREYKIGWMMQFHFLKYLLPDLLRLPFVALHELLQTCFWFLNRYPGYLVVSTFERRDQGPLGTAIQGIASAIK